jgi:hypothetical protein
MLPVVVDGALLRCTQGDVPCPLKATNHRSVLVDDKPVATILDFVPGVNLKTFGTCKALGKPCTPAAPAPWVHGSDRNVQANDQLLLLLTDKLACPAGPGVITVASEGQARQVWDE